MKKTCFKDPKNHNLAPKKVQALKAIISSNLKCLNFSITSSFSLILLIPRKTKETMSNMRMIKQMMNNRTNIKTMTNRRTKEMMNNMKTTIKQWAIGGPKRQWTTWKLGRLVKRRNCHPHHHDCHHCCCPHYCCHCDGHFHTNHPRETKTKKNQQWTTRRLRRQWATQWS